MQKRVLELLITILLVIASIQFISSASCNITDSLACSGGNYIVMGVSDLTNAHGEFPDTGTYDYVLCCDFSPSGTGDTSCSLKTDPISGEPINKIIGLSSSTNAHAEIPEQTNYLTDVCYEDLKCVQTSTLCSETNPLYPLQVLSLSNYTNAHIGASGDYPLIQICCMTSELRYKTCQLTNASWQYEEAYEGTNVGLIVKGTDCGGVGIKFEVWKDNLLFDSQMESPANVEFDGDTAIGYWIAEEPGKFYFKATLVEDDAKTINSKDLGNPLLEVKERDIDYCDEKVICSDYTLESDCDTDYCDVAETSAPEGIDCGDSAINCSCSWVGTEECKFVASYEGDGNGTGFGGGTCEYKQETTDDCLNGYLTYNWIVNWTGLPEDKPAWCVDDSETIECPAQVQLPFFNTYSILIAIALIVLIYIILIRKKSSRKKRK